MNPPNRNGGCQRPGAASQERIRHAVPKQGGVPSLTETSRVSGCIPFHGGYTGGKRSAGGTCRIGQKAKMEAPYQVPTVTRDGKCLPLGILPAPSKRRYLLVFISHSSCLRVARFRCRRGRKPPATGMGRAGCRPARVGFPDLVASRGAG